MKSAVPAVLLALVLSGNPVLASEEDAAAGKPGVLTRTLQMLHLKHASPAAAPAHEQAVLHHELELKLAISPLPITLSDTHQLKVSLSVYNRSRHYAHLDFPTSQRIEVLIKDGAGKTVTQWSEDQPFTNDPASVTINPGERLEYSASVATREMAAGQSYLVVAYFPNFEELKIEQTVTPVK